MLVYCHQLLLKTRSQTVKPKPAQLVVCSESVYSLLLVLVTIWVLRGWHAPLLLLLGRHSIPLHLHLWLLPWHRLAWHRLAWHGLAVTLHWLAHRLAHWLTVALHRLLLHGLAPSLRLLAHWLPIALHWLLTVALRRHSLGHPLSRHSVPTISHALRGHALWLLLLLSRVRLLGRLRLTLRLLGLLGLLLRSGRLDDATRCGNLRQKIVLLKVAAKFVVIDALLDADEYIVELQVELVSLLQKHLELILHDKCLVDVLKELVLFGIVSNRVDQLLHSGRILLNLHCDSLLLLLDCLVLRKVFRVLGLESLKDLSFLSSTTVDLHEFFNSLQVVMHGHAFLHDLFLAESALLKLVQSGFNRLDGWVLVDILSLS